MTLRELCNACGVSRRAVQGYEKAGLVRPSGRDKHGWLLYDPAARERIRIIHMYQRFGFQVKEIGPLLSLPPEAQKELLITRKHQMEQQRAALDETLALLTEMINTISPSES